MISGILAKQYIKSLLKSNQDVIEKYALRNCHCIGLHSFVLTVNPKVRLFIADENCTLRNSFDYKNPIVPIHGHKYNDYFIPLFKNSLIQHLYETITEFPSGDCASYTMSHYNRLDDHPIEATIGSERLRYLGAKDRRYLKGHELHTVSIPTTEKSAWLVIEDELNEDFDQVCYGELVKQNSMYMPFENPINYIKEYLEL